MSKFIESKYQKVVRIYTTIGKGNAVIDAVAGSGKTTTLVNILRGIPKNKKVLFLAFNKDIVEELNDRVGDLSNVTVKTLHSLGASILYKNFKSKLSDDKYKAYVNNRINNGMIKPSLEIPSESLLTYKNNILKLVDLGRVNLSDDFGSLSNLADKHNIDLVNNEVIQASKVMTWGAKQVDVMDFTDMIFLPNVKAVKCPQYDWVFIDECQDLSAAQRELFLKCVKPKGRFIAVGDPRQAIYGFAGADSDSFNLLKSLPNTVKLPLSICYRCDSKIIDLAKTIVPQIEARPSASEGVVELEDKVENIKDGDMVLCRVTAPLVALCMKYISTGVKAYVKGKDIGANLINIIKKTNRKTMPEVFDRMQRELDRISTKVQSKTKCSESEARDSDMYKSYEDKMNAIEVVANGIESAQEVMNTISTIFSDDEKNGICLSTIHKSKGLESDRVFILCPEKLYLKHCMSVPWMAEQEKNLVYVAYTRAKHYLGFVRDFES